MRIVPRLVVFAVFLAMSIMLVLPVSAAQPAASNLQQYPPCPSPAAANTHCVQPGEWIYCIGRAYQVQPWDIAYASGIPGPYGPAFPQYWYGNPYGYYHPYYSYYHPYFYPWNFVYPGQVLNIPFTITVNGTTRTTAWYNIPPQPVGVPCPAQPQVQIPAGWPPPPPTTTMPYPVYPTPY